MDDLVVNDAITIPAAELDESFARSGGPGGQNVNKVNTKVILRWNLRESAVLSDAQRARLEEKLSNRLTKDGELVISSTKTRDQARNREDARARLAEAVRKALQKRKKRRKTKPSKAAKAKRLSDKRHRAKVKEGRRNPEDS